MTKKKEEERWVENPKELSKKFSRIDHFVETHQKAVWSIGGILSAIILAFIGYRYYMSNQEEEAQAELFHAVYYFEEDSLEKALHGDGNHYGFLEVIERYGRTQASNLARFYAGAATLKLKQFDAAIVHLEDFSTSDWLLQARAYALTGDAYQELDQFSEAASYYWKAAEYRSNKAFSPLYYKKAALAYEAHEDYEKALRCYTRILENHYGSTEYDYAKKQAARLKALSKAT